MNNINQKRKFKNIHLSIHSCIKQESILIDLSSEMSINLKNKRTKSNDFPLAGIQRDCRQDEMMTCVTEKTNNKQQRSKQRQKKKKRNIDRCYCCRRIGDCFNTQLRSQLLSVAEERFIRWWIGQTVKNRKGKARSLSLH